MTRQRATPDILSLAAMATRSRSERPSPPPVISSYFRSFAALACLMAGSLSQSAASADARQPERVLIAANQAELEVFVEGRGKTIVMLPSWARGAADFDDMRARLAKNGLRVITPNPRGIGASSGPLDNWAMDDQAGDVAAVIRATGKGPVTLLGHAYGNRVARAVASRYPDLVCDLILVAAGGRIAPPQDVLKAVSDGADLRLPPEERREAIAKAHFAPGHDPGPWIGGWYPAVGMAQQALVVRDNPSRWWDAGGRSILVIQPRQDAAAPPENAELLKRENPARVDLVYLENSGHAAFPEQPDELERLITARVKPNRRCKD